MHGDTVVLARANIDAERAEIDLYERHSDFVSYGFYVARRIEQPDRDARLATG